MRFLKHHPRWSFALTVFLGAAAGSVLIGFAIHGMSTRVVSRAVLFAFIFAMVFTVLRYPPADASHKDSDQ
jgi:hypothetical protein